MSTQRQGNLNRLRGHVVFNQMSELSVSASELGPEGIRLSFENNATDQLPTMTGMVPSPKPYQEVTLTISVVKSMPMGARYKTQFERSTLVGTVVVWPDIATGTDIYGDAAVDIGTFQLEGMALENIREMSFAGTEATFNITLRGYYQVNQDFFSGNS